MDAKEPVIRCEGLGKSYEQGAPARRSAEKRVLAGRGRRAHRGGDRPVPVRARPPCSICSAVSMRRAAARCISAAANWARWTSASGGYCATAFSASSTSFIICSRNSARWKTPPCRCSSAATAARNRSGARPRCWSGSGSASGRVIARRSFPAANASGSPSPGPWSASPAVYCSTSRPAISITPPVLKSAR